MSDNPSKNSGSNNGNNSSQPKQLQSESKNSESSETKATLPSSDPQPATVKKQPSEVPETPKDEQHSTFKLPKQALVHSDIKRSETPVLVSANNSTTSQSHSQSQQQQQQQSTSTTAGAGSATTSGHPETNPPALSPSNSQFINPTPNPSLINTTTANTPAVGATGNAPVIPPPPPSGVQTPTILNKNTITNINKSLKAKQKVIHTREPHLKNPTLISNIINTSPQSTVFPNLPGNTTLKDGDSSVNLMKNSSSGNNANNNDTFNSNVTTGPATEISKIGNTDGSGNTPDHTLSNQPSQSQTTSQNQSQPQPQLPPPPSAASFMLHPNNSSTNMSTSGSKHDTLDSQPKQAKKKISKQNSTKTDFFAARLASAVDDIESSDSDETFVYENNDNGFDSNNNNNTIDNASVSGSIAAPAAINGSTSGGALRTPSIFEGEQLSHYYEPTKQPFKLPSNKAPSIANSINSNNNNLDTLLKRPAHLRELSGYSTNDNDARASLPPAISDRLGPASPSNLGYENMSEFQRNSSIAHSINEGYNDDTFSYNEVEDDLVDEVSTDDGEIGRSNNNTLIASSNQQPPQQQQQQQYSQSQQQLHPQSSSQHLQAPPSVTPSLSTKNTSKKNYKSSTSSSKLRTTASKLFDKKGSQPRRYSTIPDDIDIEDLDEDEFMYYDNNVRFPANETFSLLKNQRIPHYRSLNLNYPIVKRQNKRYLSTGQPLESSDHGSAKDANVANNNNNGNTVNNGNRVFPFPYQDQSYNYYYDYDDFDQESQRYSPNFDLPDLPLNRAASRNFSGNTHPQNRFGNSHFFLPRKTDQNNSRSSFCKSCIYMFLSLILVLVVGFMFGFVLATTKDLTDVGITSIENPIVSKDELVFNIVVEAFNPGWFSVDINEVELDLFARSGYLPDDDGNNDSDIKIKTGSQKVETVKLGTILNLENPMTFKGGIISREPTVQKGEVKLLDPGKNITVDALSNKKASDDNSKKWEIICANPFDLIITGILKYDLPFARTTRSVVVRKTGYIDPTLFVIPQEGMTL